MPCFYGINYFLFEHMSAFSKFAAATSQAGLKHLTFIHIGYGPVDGTDFECCTRILRELSRLRKLEIEFDEGKWFVLPKRYVQEDYGRSTKFTKAEQLPGILNLAVAASKAQEYVVDGNCPMIKNYFEDVVKKLKAGEKVKEARKPRAKRENKDDEDGSNGRGIKPVRRA
jgi:hypothetical protein